MKRVAIFIFLFMVAFIWIAARATATDAPVVSMTTPLLSIEIGDDVEANGRLRAYDIVSESRRIEGDRRGAGAFAIFIVISLIALAGMMQATGLLKQFRLAFKKRPSRQQRPLQPQLPPPTGAAEMLPQNQPHQQQGLLPTARRLLGNDYKQAVLPHTPRLLGEEYEQ